MNLANANQGRMQPPPKLRKTRARSSRAFPHANAMLTVCARLSRGASHARRRAFCGGDREAAPPTSSPHPLVVSPTPALPAAITTASCPRLSPSSSSSAQGEEGRRHSRRPPHRSSLQSVVVAYGRCCCFAAFLPTVGTIII
jgi:hypothetical protein